MKKIISCITGSIILFGFYVVNQNDINIDNIMSERKAENIETSESDKELINIEYDANKNTENYVTLNDNKTTLNSDDKELLKEKGTNHAWQKYNGLDDLGRGQKVSALVDRKQVVQRSSKYLKDHGILYDNRKIYERPDFPTYVHVSGEYSDGWFDKSKMRWKGQNSNNGNVDLGTYNGWLYNKSHTLGWSLGGDMETHNVTLGTRSQNVGSGQKGGMGYPEKQVRDAVKKHKDIKIYYESEPVYKGSELVPRGTHVEAYSVNDNGKSLNLNVWIFNRQKDIKINYKNGSWSEH